MPYLIDPAKTCPVCGTWLGDRGDIIRPCPFGPHSEDEYPRSAA